jgi:hypothetical protein
MQLVKRGALIRYLRMVTTAGDGDDEKKSVDTKHDNVAEDVRQTVTTTMQVMLPLSRLTISKMVIFKSKLIGP